MVLLLFGIGLTQVSNSAIQPGPKMRIILEVGGYVAVASGAAAMALLIALRQMRGPVLQRLLRGLRFLPDKIHAKVESTLGSFEEGMQSMRKPSYTALLVLYTVIEWLVIAGAFYCTCRAFPTTAMLGITDVVILLGFVAFGSAVQIPGVGGGMQIATVVVLTEFFGVPFEAASGIALVLWITTFVTIVPMGLALAFHEGIKFRNLRHLDSAVATGSK